MSSLWPPVALRILTQYITDLSPLLLVLTPPLLPRPRPRPFQQRPHTQLSLRTGSMGCCIVVPALPPVLPKVMPPLALECNHPTLDYLPSPLKTDMLVLLIRARGILEQLRHPARPEHGLPLFRVLHQLPNQRLLLA